MRVISGIAKGRKLFSLPQRSETRPITDRGKESLFNILGGQLGNATFLDLFAGTGSVGIEALSRGAKLGCFVEQDRKAFRVIKKNLNHTDLADLSDVICIDVFKLLGTRPIPYDLIFIAPPQYHQLWLKTLHMIDENIGWVSDQGMVIVQIDPSEFESLPLKNLILLEKRSYGRVCFCFYKMADIEDM